MENPFEKRAHEHLRDTEAFLSIVSPDPAHYYLEKPAQDGRLFDRLVVMLGTPGSGKTTLAKLFEYASLDAVTRREDDVYKPLSTALHACRALENNRPCLLGTRLPMESDYRGFWEFPYPDSLRFGLMTALVQARAVLGWLRSLEGAGIRTDQVAVLPRPEEAGALETIGGETLDGLRTRAQSVEEAVYSAVNALIPPRAEDLPEEATSAYRPFDVIETFRLPDIGELRPLVVLDDVHNLHPDQYDVFHRWLARRELKVSRWMLTRVDAIRGSLFELLHKSSSTAPDLPGITAARDFEVIWLQGQNRREERKEFRRLARDISGRYTRRIRIFVDRGITDFPSLLDETRIPISKSDTDKLEARVDRTMRELAISDPVKTSIFDAAEKAATSRGGGRDLILALASIAAHSWSKRQPQTLLFDPEEPTEVKPRKLDADTVRGAALHLHHEFGAPYYFGFDVLADAASGNIEQFLRLASILVQDAMTRLVRRRRSLALDAKVQNDLLRERAFSIIRDWNFPRHVDVRRLLDRLGEILVAKTLEPNASLGSGPNTYGILQEEVERDLGDYPDLREVLRFGHAYNAFALIPNYECKNKEWFLLELGGIPCLRYGLTLQRGNFVEGSLPKLSELLEAR